MFIWHIHTYIHIRTHTHIHTQVNIHNRVQGGSFGPFGTYIHTYIHIRTHTHIHTQVNIHNRVQGGSFGACLMAKPELVAECVASMCSSVKIPITVKHRIGIDDRDSYEDMYAFVDTVCVPFQ